ncbi:MAG: nuclease (SNase) [Rhodospirillaceae bacterium]|nr:nuclease (SNase) [Magnetovibrio sp.]MAY68687.1 nuclease (SNase) [Rhodospirillaceae bacterium]|tara:strand:+ start:700 stop:1491 length:792 start_codon:yes stop_codon:yes gene_type:complete
MKVAAFLFILFLWAAPVAAQDALTPGEDAVVTAVVDGDTVFLDRDIVGASQVRLTGIQAPKLPLGRIGFKEWPLAKEAKAALESLLLNRPVQLFYGSARMDRHGRLLAHLVGSDGTWAQGEMLRRGMARVYTFPDNRERAAEMYKLEADARRAKRGIWADPFYAVRAADPQVLARDIDTFQVIEGRVTDAADVRGVIYLNFGANWRTDFTIRLDRKAARLFKRAGLGPDSYKGRQVRVRGWLKDWNGPMIEATHPEQIEVLAK